MPPSAISNLPARSRTAPVKAPLTWPNSSLAASDSGSAAQLTWISGCARRSECACRWRATSSLPTPVSPVISTVRSEAATVASSVSSARTARLAPRICSPAAWLAVRCRSRATSSRRAAVDSSDSISAVVRTAAPASAAKVASSCRSTPSKARGSSASAVRAPTMRLSSQQRAAQAGVHVGEFAVLAGEHAVEGIGQARVGGEAHRFARAQDGVEPRVLAARVVPHHRLGRQPHGRQRHQRVALQSQQAGCVAGDQPLHRRQQPLVAVAGRQRGRQVARDVEQGREGRVLHAGSFRGVIKYITTLSSQ